MMGGQPIVKTPEDITSVSIPNFITNEVYTSGDLVRKAAQYQYVELAKPNAARQPTNVASYWLNQDVKVGESLNDQWNFC